MSTDEKSIEPSVPSDKGAEKANEASSIMDAEKISPSNPEKATPEEKKDLENLDTAVPTVEEAANAKDETKPSENDGSDSKAATTQDKVDKLEEKPAVTDTSESPSTGNASGDNVAVDSAQSTPSADDQKDGESKGAPAVVEQPKKRTRKKWKKPVGKPNRPLSAYNLYFQKERAIMLGDAAEKTELKPGEKRVHRKTHGKIGFAEMAKIIGAKWKQLPEEEKEEFVKTAADLKEKYAKDLADWREEQKKKAMMNTMGAGPKSKLSKLAHANDDLVQQIAEDRENLLRQHQAFRMQMMQEMQGGHMGRYPGEGQGRHMPTIEYLRNMQDDRTGQFFGRSRNGAPSSLFSHYPSAAEGSGRDLYQLMGGMASGPEGQGREPDQFRQFKMGPTGGAMGTSGGSMGGSSAQMGNTGMVPVNNGPHSSAPHHQYEMDRYHMHRQNHMHEIHHGHRGMASHEAPSYNNMEASMRRFQQYGHYN